MMRGVLWSGLWIGRLPGIAWILCTMVALVFAGAAAADLTDNSASEKAFHIQTASLLEGAVDRWPAADDVPEPGAQVALGHEWRKHMPTGTGIWTYRLVLPPLGTPGSNSTDAVIYVPRAGNRLRFLFDGQELAQFGNLRAGNEDFSPYPLLLRVSSALLNTALPDTRNHELLVQVAGDNRRYTGLSAVWWGDDQSLRPRFEMRRFVTEYFFYLILWLDVLFALGSTIAGWFLRERSMVAFGITSALGAVHYYFWCQTTPSLPFGMWLFAQDVSLAWNLLGMQLLCFHLMHLSVPWFERGLKVVLVAYYPLASALAVTGTVSWPKLVATNLLNIGLTVAAMLLVRHAWKHRNYVTVPLAVFSTLNVPAVLWTQWNAWVSPAPSAYEQLYLTPYVRLLYMLVICVCLGIFLLRTVHAQARSEELLRETVEQQRAELSQFYQEQQTKANAETARAERERIMRDMHDSMGVHLLSLMALLKVDDLPREAVATEVRDIMETLRLSIDTMATYDGDLLCMLGQVRFRIKQRLSDEGIELKWLLKEEGPALVVDPSVLAHLRRMLVEIFVNIIKHAKAKTVTVQVLHDIDAQRCSIVITDDGRGFDAATVQRGQGLNSMTWRSTTIGAEFEVGPNEPKGTVVRLTVPCAAA